MIDIDTCAFIACVVGLVCYLWGYSSGSRFTLEQVNKQLEKKIRGE